MKTQIKVNREIAALYREFYNCDRKKISSVVACHQTVQGSAIPTTYPHNKIKSDNSMADINPHIMYLSARINNSRSNGRLDNESGRKNSWRDPNPKADRNSHLIQQFKES
jgi:hypothetical protein